MATTEKLKQGITSKDLRIIIEKATRYLDDYEVRFDVATEEGYIDVNMTIWEYGEMAEDVMLATTDRYTPENIKIAESMKRRLEKKFAK